jgi:hypothetical protein
LSQSSDNIGTNDLLAQKKESLCQRVKESKMMSARCRIRSSSSAVPSSQVDDVRLQTSIIYGHMHGLHNISQLDRAAYFRAVGTSLLGEKKKKKNRQLKIES